MEFNKNKNAQILQVRSLTWYKDSHSLFDYQANKVESKIFNFPTAVKSITFYRSKKNSSIIALSDSSELSKDHDLNDFQFLTHFQIKHTSSINKLKLEFDQCSPSKLKKINSQRLKTDQSISSYNQKQQETFLIVRKIKDINSEQKGYKLIPGQILKLGRVQYFVSQVREGNNVNFADKKSVSNESICNRRVMKFDPKQYKQKTTQQNACKICLQDVQSKQNFLFNPCKCSGSCGTVHLECLVRWIHFKVKKQVIGGTLHFNFNKFQCQVCKKQLPMIIDVNGTHHELLPIQKPQGNYLILEGASQKSKSVMIIQNIPQTGIKLGRGHECEIRITDISVSRNHAQIKNVGNSFYVFDNKSKFGTLIKDKKMSVQIGRLSRGVQIGRTTLNFQLKKQSSRESKTEKGNRSHQ